MNASSIASLLPTTLSVLLLSACAAKEVRTNPTAFARSTPQEPKRQEPAQTDQETVETGADPSRLLLRTELAMQHLETPGPGSRFINSLKLDVPLTADTAVAMEVPVIAADMPLPAEDEFGMGDVFLRGRQVSNSETGSTIVGVELGLDTATDETLGSGKWQANPSLAYVHRFSSSLLLATALKQRLSVGGDEERDDLNRSEARLIGIWLHPQGRWLMLDWQPSFDWNRDGDMTNVLEAEAGMMTSRSFGVSIRPGFAFGENQDRDYSVQVGLRMFF